MAQLPNVIAAFPNIGGPCAQHRKVWLTPTTAVWNTVQ